MYGSNMKCLIIFCVTILHCTASFEYSYRTENKKQRCIPIKINECKVFGYDYTTPIDMYSSVSVSYKQGKKYIENLATIKVSGQLQECARIVMFLFCSVYSPICFQQHKDPILPCKGVCDRLNKNCGTLLRKYNIQLPQELNCEELPEHNSGVCIQPSALFTKEQVKKEKGLKPSSSSSSSSGDTSTPTCNCTTYKPQKPRYRNYRKAQYVIEASITSKSTLANGHAKIIVNVTKVFKSGKIQPKLGKMRLWSPTSCLCQNIDYDVKYIIVGVENKRRLVVDRKTFILPMKEYENKIIKWKKKCEKRGKCAKSHPVTE